MGGRLLFPVFPNKRLLPVGLTVLGVAGIGAGLVLDDTTLLTVGVLGLGGVGAGYVLSRLVLGDPADDPAGDIRPE